MVDASIDRKDLANIKDVLNALEKNRNEVTLKSREVVQLSKKVIYSVHRSDLKSAEKDIVQMQKLMADLEVLAKNPKFKYTGSYKVAVQEFVEAICFFEFVKNNRIPTNKELKFIPEFYLLGLIDLTGELVRNAINSAINEDYKKAVEIERFVSDLYDELMKFDFSNGELRKKFDSVKYDLKKLEDLVLGLKISNKI